MKKHPRADVRRIGWLVGAFLGVAGCSHEDAKPARAAQTSLGLEIYGVLCDRVGAQSLREDLTGASYASICHGDAANVDTNALPPAADPAVRTQAIARVEAIGRHKNALIAALDVVFPDDDVVGKNVDGADPNASCEPVPGRARRDQLRGMLARLVPGNDETVPESSRAAARSVEPLTGDQGQDARVAFARIGARRGYMPPELSAGLLGTVLTAPRLRDTLGATMHLLSADATPLDAVGTEGTGHPAMKRFLGAAKADLMTAPPADEGPLVSARDPVSGRTLLSRPRTNVELAKAVLLEEDKVFSNGPPLLVTKRDARGVAVVKLVGGKIPAPFVDKNGDGLADLDSLGHFVTSGAPVPDPFVGDEKSDLYDYTDARATAASALLRHVSPLADPDGGNEALLSAFEGLEPLLKAGPGREALLDLAYAGAQLAADPSTDETLAFFGQLFKDEPQLMARVLGNLLDAKKVLDAHPETTLPTGSTLVDELLDVVVKIGDTQANPNLLEDVLDALSDDRGALLAEAVPPLLKFNDRMTYDPTNLNGPPLNRTTGKVEAPRTLVDRSQPATGWNRSLFQRFLQLLGDGKGVTACNKKDAKLHAKLQLDPDPTVPLTDATFPEQFVFTADGALPAAPQCSILKIEDLSTFYMRAMVDPAKCPSCTKAALHFRFGFLAAGMSPDAFRGSTGLDGLWPSGAGEDIKLQPKALNRLVFFDVLAPKPASADPIYDQVQTSVADLNGPYLGTAICPEQVVVDPNVNPSDAIGGVSAGWSSDDASVDGKVHGLRVCANASDNFAQRNADTIFALEYNHSYDALGPLTEVFIKHKNEALFTGLLDVLAKHWNIENGVVRAEPALAEILGGDLPASLTALAKATHGRTVTRCAADSKVTCLNPTKIPAERVLADGLRAMFDSAWADRVGLVDRRGQKQTSDGKRVTPFNLVRAALNAEDAAIAKDPARQAKWLAARSHIVDEFLTIDGRGADAKFRDQGIPRIVPLVVDLLRAQRSAKCAGSVDCPALRTQVVADLEKSLSTQLTTTALSLVDVLLADDASRGELGRMTSYLTRQDGPLAGAGDGMTSASSTPFANVRGPGVLDNSIAALVDAIGSLGDLHELRALYPLLANGIDNIDPQLSLLSRLNARAFDPSGKELCANEIDPEEVLQGSLARLALTVTPPGEPKTTALQIFLDAIADVNRVDSGANDALAPDDYTNVFKNLQSLLTDPESGLEQLYASVQQATKR